MKKKAVKINLLTVLDSLPGYVFRKSVQGLYLGCNKAAADVAGLQYPKQIVGKSDLDMPWHEQAKAIFDFDREVLNTGQEKTVLESRKLANGRVAHFLTCKKPIKQRKLIIELLCVSLEMPVEEENKSKTRLLAKSEQELAAIYLKNILLNLPEPIYWMDTQGIIQGCNEAEAKLFGFKSTEEMIGKSIYDIAKKLKWDKSVADALHQHDLKVMQTGQQITTEEIDQSPNGEFRTFMSHKAPLYNDNDEIIGLIGTSIDITQRKKMEKDLQQAQIEAEAASRAKSEFLRNMEHQLRTPFTGVYSMIEMLAEMEQVAEKKELLEIVYCSAKELLDILNEIIDYSRNQMEKTTILAKKFNFKELIEKAIAIERPAALVKKLNFIFDYPDDLPTIFISDPKRLQRIILNLLSNAVKFTFEGSITVRVKLGKKIDDKNYILQLFVIDTGIGIAEENQSLIYERFYRVSPANQNKYAGAGLGLHIVKQLIEELEGEIDVISELHQGATFICTFLFKRPLLDAILSEKQGI